MRDEYDVSQGERGKFHHEGARLNVPVYLAADVLEHYSKLASEQGITPEEMVSALLRRAMEKEEPSE